MHKNKIISLFILMAILMSFLSCSPEIRQKIKKRSPTNVYDSAFPGKDDSKALSDVMKSIKRISSTVYYSSYLFAKKDHIVKNDIPSLNFKRTAEKVKNTHQSTSGTATIIFKDDKNIALVTCAHILAFPDTVVKYYDRKDITAPEYVKSISVKQKQMNLILSMPDLGVFKILAMDSTDDIAVLGANISQFSNSNVPVMDVPIGNPTKLKWASFVYVIGYPEGFKMITRAIVSEPNKDQYGSFIMDALFNKGFSGGVVLAIKGGVPNFEWVGMANTATAKIYNVLKPDENKVDEYDAYTPYKGPIYLGQRSLINYGITQAVSVNKIKDFFKKNESKFKKDGYNFRYILH